MKFEFDLTFGHPTLHSLYATMSTPEEIAAKDAALLLGEVRVRVRLGLELG